MTAKSNLSQEIYWNTLCVATPESLRRCVTGIQVPDDRQIVSLVISELAYLLQHQRVPRILDSGLHLNQGTGAEYMSPLSGSALNFSQFFEHFRGIKITGNDVMLLTFVLTSKSTKLTHESKKLPLCRRG